MLPVRHILFPIDFSERCCHAAPFVERMATRFQSKITLFSVAQLFPYGGGDPGGVVMINEEEVLEELKLRLNGALRKEFAHLPVARVVELGDPAQAIVDFAHTNNVDLIMMPTHGYGPFRSLLLGSVTAKVLHDAECPVWTAAHIDEPPGRYHVDCHNVLCAVDGAPKSIPLIRQALEFASEMKATFRLVHVIAGMEGLPSGQLDRSFEESMRKQVRESIEALMHEASVEAPLCVAVGNIAEGVREEAIRHGADLIFIGRGVLHEPLGRLRTHAYSIIRHAPCPVLSV